MSYPEHSEYKNFEEERKQKGTDLIKIGCLVRCRIITIKIENKPDVHYQTALSKKSSPISVFLVGQKRDRAARSPDFHCHCSPGMSLFVWNKRRLKTYLKHIFPHPSQTPLKAFSRLKKHPSVYVPFEAYVMLHKLYNMSDL